MIIHGINLSNFVYFRRMLYARAIKVLHTIIFLLFAGPSISGFHSNSNNHLNALEQASTVPPLRNLWQDPYFDIMMPKNVTALVGKSAYLSCRVRNLGNRTVRIKSSTGCIL